MTFLTLFYKKKTVILLLILLTNYILYVAMTIIDIR